MIDRLLDHAEVISPRTAADSKTAGGVEPMLHDFISQHPRRPGTPG
jgi:hypothetical protein